MIYPLIVDLGAELVEQNDLDPVRERPTCGSATFRANDKWRPTLGDDPLGKPHHLLPGFRDGIALSPEILGTIPDGSLARGLVEDRVELALVSPQIEPGPCVVPLNPVHVKDRVQGDQLVCLGEFMHEARVGQDSYIGRIPGFQASS